MASSSSMKMIDGAFSLARAKASRTSLAPSPMNICTSWGPASFRKVAWVWWEWGLWSQAKGTMRGRFGPAVLSSARFLCTPSQVLTLVCAAQARASRVFPVPGGPYISTPFGGWIPKFSNFSLWFIGRTMASTSCQEEVLSEESEAPTAPTAQLLMVSTPIWNPPTPVQGHCLLLPPYQENAERSLPPRLMVSPGTAGDGGNTLSLSSRTGSGWP